MREYPRGTHNTVAELEKLLREAGFVQDIRAQWRRDARVFQIEGSRVNGFWLAEVL